MNNGRRNGMDKNTQHFSKRISRLFQSCSPCHQNLVLVVCKWAVWVIIKLSSSMTNFSARYLGVLLLRMFHIIMTVWSLIVSSIYSQLNVSSRVIFAVILLSSVTNLAVSFKIDCSFFRYPQGTPSQTDMPQLLSKLTQEQLLPPPGEHTRSDCMVHCNQVSLCTSPRVSSCTLQSPALPAGSVGLSSCSSSASSCSIPL